MHTCIGNSLPSAIIIEILSRLPTDSVLQCRRVCKTWRRLIRHHSFAHKHLHQLLQLHGNSDSNHSSLLASKVGSGFLFCFAFTRETGNQIYYGEYNDRPNTKLRRINQPPTVHQSIIGSCNGLVCFSKDGYGPHHNWNYVHEPTYVCNPITNECVNFPGLFYALEKKLESMVCGFGYHQSLNKYKIVKIYYIQNESLGQVQVYTLGGDNRWRDLGEAPYSLRYTWQSRSDDCSPFGTFANGALHWLDMEQKIVSFDLAEEKFYLLLPPPFVRDASVRNYFKLQVLGGCLCFIHQKQDKFLDIWFLRKKGEHSCYNVNEQDYDLISWIKEFSIPIKSEAVPFALTNSGHVLLHYNFGVFCYDPETTALSDNLISNNCYRVLHVVPHMNSLVSLKGLNEEYWDKKRYDVNPAPKDIFIKQQRKGDREIDVNPSLTMSQYLGKQAVSPIQAIDSDLNKSIPSTVGLEASHSSKVADRNVGDSRKRKEKSLNCKSHCSDRSKKRANSPQELDCSDENSPLSSPAGHRSSRSIREGGSGVGGSKKIVAEVEEFSDDDGNIGGTCREVSVILPPKRAPKRHRDGLDMNDQGSEKSGCEPDRPRGPDVGQPRERGKGSSLDRPLPEYTAPQSCPPNFLMVAGFPVLPKYKDLYTRVIASKGHMASDTKVKSMFIQATMVTELLETIQQMSELSSRDVTSTNLQQWRASVDTASAMDFHVSWLDDKLHLLESKIRDVEELKATKQSLEAEVRGSGKKISLLRSKMEEARRAYEAAKLEKAELIARVATVKASLASFEADSQVTTSLSYSALGSCLGL